ncbi:hypothetical protein BpHYR1_039558, partial [Brachionus plicatilis]
GNYKQHASNNYNRHGTENSRNGKKYQNKSYMVEVKKDDPDLQNIISKYETKSYMLRYEQSNSLGAKHVKLLDVPANVDNNSVTGILDTGSTTSVISKDLVDRLDLSKFMNTEQLKSIVIKYCIEQQRQVGILAEIGLNQLKPAYCLDLSKVNGCVRRIRIDGV